MSLNWDFNKFRRLMLNLYISKNLIFIISLLLVMIIILSVTGCSTSATTILQPAATSEAGASIPVATSTAASVVPQRAPGGPGSSGVFASVAPTYQDLVYATLSSTQKLQTSDMRLLDAVWHDTCRFFFAHLDRICSNSAIILHAHLDHVVSSAL